MSLPPDAGIDTPPRQRDRKDTKEGRRDRKRLLHVRAQRHLVGDLENGR